MVSRNGKNKGGRGRKASKSLRLQGVWNYSEHEDNVGNERSKAVINFYMVQKSQYKTMKDFLEETILFYREQVIDGKYRPAQMTITSEMQEAIKRLNSIVSRLESIDFSDLRAVVPSEHQHHVSNIEQQIYSIRGDTNIMVGSATSFEDDSELEAWLND